MIPEPVASYGDLPPEYTKYSTSEVCLVPAPYDGTSTWMKGADRGPAAILDASANMELYDIETDSEVYRRGIHTLPPVATGTTPESAVAAIQAAVAAALADNKFVVTIGGEHSVTVGAVRAHADRYPDLSILQLDAHSDLRDSFEGSMLNHACVMARVKEQCPVFQAGIRSMDISEKAAMDPQRVIFAHDYHADPAQAVARIIEGLGSHVYLTLDLDVFDPSEMPSTGTPEPGGFRWTQVMHILEAVIRTKTLVGFDVVELCPNPANRAPDFLAAKLIYRILSMRVHPSTDTQP